MLLTSIGLILSLGIFYRGFPFVNLRPLYPMAKAAKKKSAKEASENFFKIIKASVKDNPKPKPKERKKK